MSIKIIFSISLLFFALFIQVDLSAQSSPVVNYNSKAKLTIDGVDLVKNSAISAMTEHLGEVSKKVDYPNGEASYFYEDLGIVFFTLEDEIKGLGINFNWDGDEKFPETSFTGALNIGEALITKEAIGATITSIQDVEMMCPIPIMCASANRKAKVVCTVAFEEEKISQVAFIIQ